MQLAGHLIDITKSPKPDPLPIIHNLLFSMINFCKDVLPWAPPSYYRSSADDDKEGLSFLTMETSLLFSSSSVSIRGRSTCMGPYYCLILLLIKSTRQHISILYKGSLPWAPPSYYGSSVAALFELRQKI